MKDKKKERKKKEKWSKTSLKRRKSFFLLWETAKSANCEKIAKSKPPPAFPHSPIVLIGLLLSPLFFYWWSLGGHFRAKKR